MELKVAMSLNPKDRKHLLSAWIAKVCSLEEIFIDEVEQLQGGAIQQNWLVCARISVNGHTIYKEFVLRTNATATIAESRSREEEFRIMKIAFHNGITVPKPVGFCHDTHILGQEFSLVERVGGMGFGPKVVKQVALQGNGDDIVTQLAGEMAKIHQLDPEQDGLDCINTEECHHGRSELVGLQRWLDQHHISRPALDWGIRWAIRNLPEQREAVFLHRDFRTGNFLIDEGGLGAILDWEFSGFGDPMSDIGWFCAECWRFSRPDLAAGGLANRAVFNQAYESKSGRKINRDSVYFWELVAHLRWSVIALQQGYRHLSGIEPSLSMAITSRIVDQLELIILRMTSPTNESAGRVNQPLVSSSTIELNLDQQKPHQSIGTDLLNIARASMTEHVLPELDNSNRLTGLMINNAMSIVEREIAFADHKARAEAALLKSGSWRNDLELSMAIRHGDTDNHHEVWKKLTELTAIRSEIFKPGFATEEELVGMKKLPVN